MKRCMVVMMLAAATASCRHDAGSGELPATRPAETQAVVTPPHAVELPTAYPTVAKVLTRPLAPSAAALSDNRGMAEMMAAAQSGLLDLRAVKSSNGDLQYIATEGAAGLTEMYRRLQALDALPRPATGSSATLAAALHGLAGDLTGFFGVGAQAADRQRALLDELQGFAAAENRVNAAAQLLPKVAANYAGPAAKPGRIAIDFDEGDLRGNRADLCTLTNTGEALRNCTLLVEVRGENGTLRRNVHFVPLWAAGQTLFATYGTGVLVEGRAVGAATVPNVESLQVTAWCPDATMREVYAYLGAERDKDVEAWAKSIRIVGRYQPFVKGILSDTQRGIRLTLAEGPPIGKCRVDLTFTGGGATKRYFWELTSWAVGEVKVLSPPAGALNVDPSQVEVELGFPRSTYKRKWVFNIRV